ncbi:MAG: methyltransferase domain-containing protein [Myxococcota bacterium]
MQPDHLLYNARFPLSNEYDPDWVMANEMGPNALWMSELLVEEMTIRAGMRVLDMGCGRGMSSIFLAREFGARVWANDLWISPDDNWTRFVAAGMANQICPIKAEARQLPYAAGFFEAIFSIDSYHYYGTDDLYLAYILRFLESGGQLGMMIPGLTRPLDLTDVPTHLKKKQASGAVFWNPAECFSFHTPDWWRGHLEKTGLVTVQTCRLVDDGWKLWLQWERAREAAGGGFSAFPSDAETIEADGGAYLGFVLVVAQKR